MSACTFFGHRTTPKEIEPLLRTTLVDLIENRGVTLFYVGNHGGFDAMVYCVLKEFAAKYPLSYGVVLAYRPIKRDSTSFSDFSDSFLPDGIEAVPKRFAIDYRNRWMIDHADFVVTYVENSIASGAARFQTLAEKKGKTVIRLAS